MAALSVRMDGHKVTFVNVESNEALNKKLDDLVLTRTDLPSDMKGELFYRDFSARKPPTSSTEDCIKRFFDNLGDKAEVQRAILKASRGIVYSIVAGPTKLPNSLHYHGHAVVRGAGAKDIATATIKYPELAGVVGGRQADALLGCITRQEYRFVQHRDKTSIGKIFKLGFEKGIDLNAVVSVTVSYSSCRCL